LLQLGKGDEEFVVVAFVKIFREIGKDGNVWEDLDYFRGGDQL